MTVQNKIHDRTAPAPRNAQTIEAVVDEPEDYAQFPGEKIKVTRSIRDDPLAGMLARGQIDDAMMMGGWTWQMYHEQSEVGSICAIDPTREAVDGGRFPEPITDRQIAAFRELKQADNALGYEGKRLIYGILGQRKSITEYAMSIGLTTEREFNYIGRRLRECLDTLA